MRITLVPEIREAIMEEGGEDAYKCYQCGKCIGVCPWSQVEAIVFPVYRVPQSVRLGIAASSEDKEELAKEVEEIFRCVGCEACLVECPHGVNLPNVVRAIRRILVDYGSYSEELKATVTRIYSTGNPLGEPREKRGDWAKDLDVPRFEQGMEFLYFPCCIPAYDSRGKEVARATTSILIKAGVSFGILGEEESCCGEAIRRVGAEKVFQQLAKANITAFKNAGVKKVITASPHCYNTFKKDYLELGANFEVVHAAQLFLELIEKGKFIPRKPLNKKVAYHDPCNLGRQAGVYDEPREVLKSIQGLELIEIPNFSREYSFCCGGGGGGLWIGWDERMTHVRANQVAETGAQILAVACPYCLQMFEDSVKALNLDMEVKDIAELLSEAL